MKLLIPLSVLGILIWMRRKQYLSRRVFLLFAVLCAASGLLVFIELQEGGLREVTSVRREGDGSFDETVPLHVETAGGISRDVELRIPAVEITEAEAERILTEAAAGLDSIILGKNQFFDRVEYDLELPASLADGAIEISWTTDRPMAVRMDGRLGTDIPEEGEEVRLSAELFLRDYSTEYLRILKVYPSREDAAFEAMLQKEADILNQKKKPGEGIYLLPSRAGQEALTWYKAAEERGIPASFFVLILAVLAVLNTRQKEQQKEEERKARLIREYPELVSRLQLLLGAGLSLRHAIRRIGSDSGQTTISGAEAARCWYEMESGVLEQDAWIHFGERCGTPEYRRLALLLAQSQKKGGQILSQMLERETQDAYEGRKRAARAEGEKNAVRLLLPMGLMLVTVMIIIIVPAILSF